LYLHNVDTVPLGIAGIVEDLFANREFAGENRRRQSSDTRAIEHAFLSSRQGTAIQVVCRWFHAIVNYALTCCCWLLVFVKNKKKIQEDLLNHVRVIGQEGFMIGQAEDTVGMVGRLRSRVQQIQTDMQKQQQQQQQQQGDV
jgi:hypothetical protein